MQQLFQSAFLQALGYAIANSLWQCALVWLIYMSLTGLRSLNAASKYRCAVAAQLIGFVWFMVTFRFYYVQYNQALQNAHDIPQNIQTILSANTDLSSRVINWMVKGERLLPYVSMAYLLLMLFLGVRWISGYRQTQLIRNSGLQNMPGGWQLFAERIAGQLNIRQKIQIFLSDTVRSPLTIGFLKPVILIPVASINHLTTEQLEAVLLHELAHIKRYDYLVNIILSVVEISLFFNPFTQLLTKSIRKERENSCDDWVLRFQYEASVYAEALLRIAYLQQTETAFAMAATGKKNELLIRVKRMIGEKENRFSYRKQLLAFVIVTGILSSLAWLNPRVQHRDEKLTAGNASANKATLSYTVEPMAISISNPLFNPMFFLSKPLKEEMQKNMASAQKEINEAMLQLHDEIKEPLQAIESVTPIVANALETASLAMEHADIATELSQIDMDLGKVQLDKTLYSDSAFFAPLARKQFKTGLASSMKEMEAGLRKAKTEIVRSLKTEADVNLDKLNISDELIKVMDNLGDLGKTGIEQIVINSLNLSTSILKDLAIPRNERQQSGKENKKKQKPVPPKEKAEEQESRIEIPSEEKVPGQIKM